MSFTVLEAKALEPVRADFQKEAFALSTSHGSGHGLPWGFKIPIYLRQGGNTYNLSTEELEAGQSGAQGQSQYTLTSEASMSSEDTMSQTRKKKGKEILTSGCIFYK